MLWALLGVASVMTVAGLVPCWAYVRVRVVCGGLFPRCAVLFDLDKLPSLSISGLGCAFSCALNLRAPDPCYSEGFRVIHRILFGGFLFQQDIITDLYGMWSDIDFLVYSFFHGFFLLAVFCPCFCDIISACSRVCPDIWDVGAESSTK